MAFGHRMMLAAVIAAFPLAACAQQQGTGIAVQLVAEGFDAPVFATSPPGDPRLFVVDQSGEIWIIANGERLAEPFLDISNDVTFGGERGLLGLAFHPDYASNGRFFINNSDSDGNTRIAEYHVSADPNVADPASGVTLISIADSRSNHNGGWLAFGPDGYLYISNGDGGGGGDPDRNGQNPNTLFGKLLRIDVDSGRPYGIPPTNPFANGGGAPEVYVYGLRNAWRAAFDGDLLYIADVGQNRWEEINVMPISAAGTNFGWNIMEGAHCYDAARCNDAGLTRPVHEYSHEDGCSVTGGYVYRGSAIPGIVGTYFFADYCRGFVHSFRYNGSAARDLTDWSEAIGDIGSILSFGQDSAGELYILTDRGRVWRIVSN